MNAVALAVLLLAVPTTALSPALKVEAAENPIIITDYTLQDQANDIALEFGIPTTTLANLIQSESNWDPDAIGDNGCSYGLSQQNICVHPEISREEALNPEYSMRAAARDIQKGIEWRQYTVCSCWSLVWVRRHDTPRMDDIVPNSKAKIGAIAILYYISSSGERVKHVAYVTKVMETGVWVIEANLKPCLTDERFISFKDTHLKGFYD